MMPLSNEIRDEMIAIRRRFLEMLVPLQTSEEGRGDAGSEEELLRRALWRAARELDKLLNEGQLPGDLDLTKDDPGTRRLLQELVVRDHFCIRLLEDEGDIDTPRHSPEECGLEVYFQHGRWVATWLKLEKDMARPESLSRELLRLERGSDGRLVFTDV